MKKLCSLLVALLACLQASIAFADIPSRWEMQQGRIRACAEQLEREGIAIENIETIVQENNELELAVELSCPENGKLECEVISIDKEMVLGKSKEILTAMKKGEKNYLVYVPIAADELVSGKNELEINCKYRIDYVLVKRLGGGYEWFKAGGPMKQTPKSVSKEISKRIVLMKTSTRYFVYER